MAIGNRVNIGPGNGLLPDGTKPLPETMLTYHQWSLVTITWAQFHKRYFSHHLLKLTWKLLFKNVIQTSRGPIFWMITFRHRPQLNLSLACTRILAYNKPFFILSFCTYQTDWPLDFLKKISYLDEDKWNAATNGCCVSMSFADAPLADAKPWARTTSNQLQWNLSITTT